MDLRHTCSAILSFGSPVRSQSHLHKNILDTVVKKSERNKMKRVRKGEAEREGKIQKPKDRYTNKLQKCGYYIRFPLFT